MSLVFALLFATLLALGLSTLATKALLALVPRNHKRVAQALAAADAAATAVATTTLSTLLPETEVSGDDLLDAPAE